MKKLKISDINQYLFIPHNSLNSWESMKIGDKTTNDVIGIKIYNKLTINDKNADLRKINHQRFDKNINLRGNKQWYDMIRRNIK